MDAKEVGVDFQNRQGQVFHDKSLKKKGKLFVMWSEQASLKNEILTGEQSLPLCRTRKHLRKLCGIFPTEEP